MQKRWPSLADYAIISSPHIAVLRAAFDALHIEITWPDVLVATVVKMLAGRTGKVVFFR